MYACVIADILERYRAIKSFFSSICIISKIAMRGGCARSFVSAGWVSPQGHLRDLALWRLVRHEDDQTCAAASQAPSMCSFWGM